MKIVKIIGGLGNQMFQYALAIALQERWKDEEIKLDLHGFNGYHKHQGYQLDMLFGHRFEAATLTDVAQLAWPYPHYQLWRVGSDCCLSVGRCCVSHQKDFFRQTF